jgi:hypothetical protein
MKSNYLWLFVFAFIIAGIVMIFASPTPLAVGVWTPQGISVPQTAIAGSDVEIVFSGITTYTDKHENFVVVFDGDELIHAQNHEPQTDPVIKIENIKAGDHDVLAFSGIRIREYNFAGDCYSDRETAEFMLAGGNIPCWDTIDETTGQCAEQSSGGGCQMSCGLIDGDESKRCYHNAEGLHPNWLGSIIRKHQTIHVITEQEIIDESETTGIPIEDIKDDIETGNYKKVEHMNIFERFWNWLTNIFRM